MKLGNKESPELDLDATDWQILKNLQDDCKLSLTRLGELVGLSAPSVMDRVKKLEQSGVITGYHARLDARRLGLDITAFVGVSIDHPSQIVECANAIAALEGVQEIHHVTGQYSQLIKVKTKNTSSLERLISRIGCITGVARTETLVVLSTQSEQNHLPISATPQPGTRRKNGRAPHAASANPALPKENGT
jgi:Lrp/AsnC family leucine-responsive transcriptional regulator